MNQKLAKKLRRQAHFMCNNKTLTTYKAGKAVIKKAKDGTDVAVTGTITVDPGCMRGIYHNLKAAARRAGIAR